MKRLISFTALAVALSVGSALAADLPSQKAPPPAPLPLSWTGAYAGLNAGYNWGTNSNATSQNYAPSWLEAAPEYGEPWVNASGPLAMSGVKSNTQSGFIGGAQFGYNYQWGTNYDVGIETDIQGTGISGNSTITGAAAYTQAYNQGTNCCQTTSKATGATEVNAGLNFLGTVRGRVGYLVMPTLMLYGTGGFTYGGAYAKVTQTAVENLGYPLGVIAGINFGSVYSNSTWIGGGQQNQILTGWNAGGGVEWMFMPNWSLKGEASYWDLGRMNVNTVATAASGQQTFGGYLSNVGGGRTSVSYSGVQAKVGVNYHFNFANVAPVIAKF
jgi:outer membrane immunogenic protein